MADILTFDQMMAKNSEMLRSNLFILGIDGIDSWTVRMATKPKIAINEVEDPFLNQRNYYAGRPTWEAISITLRDPIAPAGSQKVMEWLRLVYESQTGRMGYKAAYAKDITLKGLGPDGTVVQQWTFKNAWPNNVDFGENDMASDGEWCNLTISIRYDSAVLDF